MVLVVYRNTLQLPEDAENVGELHRQLSPPSLLSIRTPYQCERQERASRHTELELRPTGIGEVSKCYGVNRYPVAGGGKGDTQQ